MQTLNQILKQLSNIASAHANVNSFFEGELYDFAASGVVEYPAMVVEKNPFVYQMNNITYSFNIYMMDLVHKDASNRTEVLSDMLQNCVDVLALLDRDDSVVGMINTNVTFNDFIDSFDQEVSGYWFNLQIKVPYALDNCAVPLRSTLSIVEDIGSAYTDLTSFIIKVDTTKAGSASDTFVLPLASGSTNITVDWGDNTTENILSSGNKTHVYPVAGIYTIKITGTFVGLYFNNSGDKLKITSIEQWGTPIWKSFQAAFYGCSNLLANYTDQPNTGLTNLFINNAFMDCALFNGDISFISGKGITRMNSAFYGCTALNQDVSAFNMTGLQTADTAFYNCSSMNCNFGSWNIALLTSAAQMLQGAGLSSANVDATLNGFETQAPNIQNGVLFRLGSGIRTSASDTSVTTLTGTYIWTITNP